MSTSLRAPAPPHVPGRVVIAVLCALLASLLLVTTAAAGDLDDARARLAQLEQQIALQQAALDETHARLEALETKIAALELVHRETQTRLIATQWSLAVANDRYQESQARLDDIARLAYQWGPMGPFAVVLGAESLGDLADRLQYLDSIADANAAVATQVATHAAQLASIRADLESIAREQAEQELDVQSRRAELVTGFLDQNAQLAQLAAARSEAAALVRRLLVTADPSMTGAGVSFGRWAELFLSRIGAPICQENLTVVVAWESAEGTVAAYDPLATTHDFPNATDFNAAGVKNYASLSDGLQATADTLALESPAHGYGPILASLAACAPAESTASAINASSWCRGCAGGMYVLNVLPLVRADYERFASRQGRREPAGPARRGSTGPGR